MSKQLQKEDTRHSARDTYIDGLLVTVHLPVTTDEESASHDGGLRKMAGGEGRSAKDEARACPVNKDLRAMRQRTTGGDHVRNKEMISPGSNSITVTNSMQLLVSNDHRMFYFDAQIQKQNQSHGKYAMNTSCAV